MAAPRAALLLFIFIGRAGMWQAVFFFCLIQQWHYLIVNFDECNMTTCQSIDSTPYMYVHVDVTQENLLATVFPSLLCGDWGLGFTWVFLVWLRVSHVLVVFCVHQLIEKSDIMQHGVRSGILKVYRWRSTLYQNPRVRATSLISGYASRKKEFRQFSTAIGKGDVQSAVKLAILLWVAGQQMNEMHEALVYICRRGRQRWLWYSD